MVDIIVIVVIAIIMAFALKGSIQHFKGEGSCCGGGHSCQKGHEVQKTKDTHCKHCDK